MWPLEMRVVVVVVMWSCVRWSLEGSEWRKELRREMAGSAKAELSGPASW